MFAIYLVCTVVLTITAVFSFGAAYNHFLDAWYVGRGGRGRGHTPNPPFVPRPSRTPRLELKIELLVSATLLILAAVTSFAAVHFLFLTIHQAP